jgi:plasmid replication initiation protein
VNDKEYDMNDKEIELLKKKTIVQHNALITARYEMTVAEKDIIYLLMAQLSNADPIDRVYHVYTKDIEKLTGKVINYGQFEKSTMKLVTRGYSIKEGEDILQVCMVSSIKHIKGKGKIAIRIDPEVRPYLFDLKANFTKHGLFVAMSLQSMYSRRIYEMLCQFKNTGVMRIKVDELKDRMCILDSKIGKDKYPNWTDFARKVLEVARKELDQHAEISFTYEAKKQGRKFTDLEFKITFKNPQLSLEFKELNTDFYKRLTDKFKLSSWQADLLIKYVPEKEIHSTLYEIQIRNVNGEIKNIGGFTAHTFENKYNLGLLGNNRGPSRIGGDII